MGCNRLTIWLCVATGLLAASIISATVAGAAPETIPNGTVQGSYLVKPGDTLSGIASDLGVSASALLATNGLQDPNKLQAGMVLTVPTPTPAAQAPASQPNDPRFFSQTGYRIANDQFWNYFNRRGGLGTFGYPISKEFLFQGFRVQFFQRLIMQLNPDGSVSTLNLLDPGLMPYTRINFSTFPAPDPRMAGAAPRVGTPDYSDKLMAFIKANVPDQWNGLPVNFWKTFNNTVTYQDAYPNGGPDPGIMPAINLEMWGVPISAPAYDPNNHNFVYQRFQRGIMHFDATTGSTQGLLLGDYLKSIITGVNLPPDLDQEAQGSNLYRQYNPLVPNGLNRPNDLPNTNLLGAFPDVVVPSSVSTPLCKPGTSGTPSAGGSTEPAPCIYAGYDISYPQGSGPYPPSTQSGQFTFGIVGVTNGRAFTDNPYLGAEYKWIVDSKLSPSIYMNLNYPAGSSASKGQNGPKGQCAPGDNACQAYNYGYNAAQHAFDYARSQSATASNWWLDVETENSWSNDQSLNAQVIQGSVDFLKGKGLTVGIYSNPSMWLTIAGSFSPGLPNWVAGAPNDSTLSTYFTPAHAFGGGTVRLVQCRSGSYDLDYALP